MRWTKRCSNGKWKKDVLGHVKGLSLVPDWARKDYEHTINWLEQWPCVRNFGLGTKLPQDDRFIIEPLSDSTIYMAYYTIAHKITRYRPDQLVPEFFDFVMLGKGKPADVSKKTGIPSEELRDMQSSFGYWYPLDWRCSALELIQNHLTFMLFHQNLVRRSSYIFVLPGWIEYLEL